MDWYFDLCDSVATEISQHQWTSNIGDFDVNSRAKTIDTLRQKLNRSPNLKLDRVQDLAGVRVDISGTIADQTQFSEEMVAHFTTAEKSEIRDMRNDPHSGYRAVHVWFTFPAGRVEVQIRTINQSAWANVYERLGDYLGRGIRYGEYGEGRTRELVDAMHSSSRALAEFERVEAQIAELTRIQDQIEARDAEFRSRPQRERPKFSLRIDHARLTLQTRALRLRLSRLSESNTRQLQEYFERMERLRRKLDADSPLEGGDIDEWFRD